jgi:YjbE family integral membrane protein
MEMEIFSAAFLSALLVIILIDLVLAGDNALVIGLAARNLPKHQQRAAILWGTAGAIIVRVVMTIGVFWLLQIPGLSLVGGLALVWIARKLLQPGEEGGHGHAVAATGTLGGAVRTIVIADTVMGIDNALAVGAAARDSVLLIVLGLAITVPIIVWGSRLVLVLVGRFPSIILLGGGVLGWTAAGMILHEPLLQSFFAGGPAVKTAVTLLLLTVSVLPWFQSRAKPSERPLLIVLPCLLLWLVMFEAGTEMWGWRVGYLSAATWSDAGLQLLRWTGWLPIAAIGLWIAQRRAPAARQGDAAGRPAI